MTTTTRSTFEQNILRIREEERAKAAGDKLYSAYLELWEPRLAPNQYIRSGIHHTVVIEE